MIYTGLPTENRLNNRQHYRIQLNSAETTAISWLRGKPDESIIQPLDPQIPAAYSPLHLNNVNRNS